MMSHVDFTKCTICMILEVKGTSVMATLSSILQNCVNWNNEWKCPISITVYFFETIVFPETFSNKSLFSLQYSVNSLGWEV